MSFLLSFLPSLTHVQNSFKFSITSSITHLSNSVHILPFTLYYSSLLTSYHLTSKTLCYTILLSLSYQTNTFIWNISPSNTVKSSPKLHAYTTNQFNVLICSPSRKTIQFHSQYWPLNIPNTTAHYTNSISFWCSNLRGSNTFNGSSQPSNP